MARKGENIYKRKDGRWEGRYIKTHKNNRAVYGYVYARAYLDVKKKLNVVKTESACQKNNYNDMNEKFSCWAQLWLEARKPSVKASTYYRYAENIKNHIIPELGHLTICQIDTKRIQEYVNKMMSEGRRNQTGGLSGKTIADILIIIKSVLNFSKTYGETVTCDFSQIIVKKKVHEMRVLTIEEEKKLNNVLIINPNKYKVGILICLYTGIRLGELCALQWKNVSFSDKTIRIQKTMQRIQCSNHTNDKEEKTKVVMTEPKSVTSNRVIPLPDFLMELLKKYKGKECEFILATENQTFAEPRIMQKYFKKYIKEAEIEDVNFHALRHTFATRCIEEGFDLKSLSEILGHSSVRTTLDKYVHVTMDVKRQNMLKVKLLL